jgi:hypothetical protein
MYAIVTYDRLKEILAATHAELSAPAMTSATGGAPSFQRWKSPTVPVALQAKVGDKPISGTYLIGALTRIS